MIYLERKELLKNELCDRLHKENIQYSPGNDCQIFVYGYGGYGDYTSIEIDCNESGFQLKYHGYCGNPDNETRVMAPPFTLAETVDEVIDYIN